MFMEKQPQGACSMRIRHLRYFLVVAEELSFVRAAARVHIEPSPLSRAIKELEVELEVALIQRVKGRIQLTWAGEVFREEARRILIFMEGAQARVHAAARGFRGRLRIGLTDGLAQSHLATLLARCREEEPLTEIRISEMTISEMIKALNHDQIDAGFTLTSDFHIGLIKNIVWTDRPVIAVPKNHPLLSLEKIPLQEISRQGLIHYDPEAWAGWHSVLHRWFYEATLPPPIASEYVSSHESMMMLVAAGYGIGIGLESQLTLYSHPSVIIRPVAEDVSSAATFLVTFDKTSSEELSRFIARAHQIGNLGLAQQ
jgi:DNA-binding transcriptional LysR family regulator